MPISSKKAQATVSEPTVRSAQPHIKPAKRAKKSKMNSNAELPCSSFSRSLLYTDMPTEPETAGDSPRPIAECVLNSEGCEADRSIVRKRPAFEETMGHLFGPFAKPKSVPRRRWELDTYSALFGPDGQMMMSEHPRHYDIFELLRNMRIRKRKKQLEDTHSELFGDTMLNRPSSSTSVDATHSRLFGENLESSESESPRQTPDIVQHWDVFEPYRGMKRRRRKCRSDAVDTHDELFAEVPEPTVRKPVKNPARFSRKTPKIVDDVVYYHLQPLVFGDQVPPLKTGKAYAKPSGQPRNPLTGAGYPVPSRESISMPDRPRPLKAAADGIPVQYPDDRNPVTGYGVPVSKQSSIINVKGWNRRRPSTAGGMFTSHFVISDNSDTMPEESDATQRRCRKRPSAAHIRMFESPRNPITDFASETDEPNEDPAQQQRQCTHASTSVDESSTRKRQLPPTFVGRRHSVLAWGKANGNVDDTSCYVADPPMIRRAAARDAVPSPITGGNTVARAKSANAIELVTPVVDVSDDFVARDGSYQRRGVAPLDGDHYFCCDGHSEVEEDAISADRQLSA